jgi:hypothetical protein
MTRPPPSRRPIRTFLTVMAISLAAGAVIGTAVGLTDEGGLPAAVHIGAALIAFAAAGAVFYACLRWWRMLDEAAQEAHKCAWWWGGSGGMLAGLVTFILFQALDARGDVPALSQTAPLVESLYHGAMAILLFQVAGYVIAWAAWWLRHR